MDEHPDERSVEDYVDALANIVWQQLLCGQSLVLYTVHRRRGVCAVEAGLAVMRWMDADGIGTDFVGLVRAQP